MPTLRLAVLLLVAACDSGNAPPADSGVPVDTSVPMLGPLPSGATLAAPELPAPPAPVAWECPAGWVVGPALTDDGAEVCRPWAAGESPTCPPGELRLPGEDVCTPLGSACGAGPFPTGAPEPTVFVDASAAAGGAGTRASPFATLAEGLAAATTGDVIGLAAGTYAAAPAVVPAGVTVRGACAANTTLDVDDPGSPALRLEGDAAAMDLTILAQGSAVEVPGTGAELTAIEIQEARTGAIVLLADASLTASRVAVRLPDDETRQSIGVRVPPGASANLSGFLVDGAMEFAILVQGPTSSVVAEDVVIRNTVPRRGRNGIAIEVQDGAVELRRAFLEANPVGLWTKGATTRVQVEDVVMADAVPLPAGVGPGIIFDGGELTVRGALFERMVSIALQFQSAGTAVLSDVVFRETQFVPEGYPNELLVGSPISAYHASTGDDLLEIQVRRASLEASTNAGLILSGSALRMDIEDLTVLDTAHSPGDLQSGDGMLLAGQGQLSLRRAVFRRTEQEGLRTYDEGTLLELYDVAVVDMLGREFDQQRGYGANFAAGSEVRGERLSVVRAREAAVLVGSGATATLSDVTVDDVRTTSTSTFRGFGMGLWAATGGELTLTRGHVSRARGLGAICTGGTTCRFTDLLVEDTESWERDSMLDLALGHGIEVQYGHLELTRVVISGNRSTGLKAAGGTLVVEDVVVRDTRHDEYDGAAGHGLTAVAGGTVTGSFVEVAANRHVGLGSFGEGSSITLSDVTVSSTDRALCAEDTCADNPGGVGVLATLAGAVSLDRFEIGTSHLAGVMIAPDSQIDLRNGTVRNNPIGANIQVPGYDITRIQDGVSYVDNGVNLDSASLPVPDLGDSIDVPDPVDEDMAE